MLPKPAHDPLDAATVACDFEAEDSFGTRRGLERRPDCQDWPRDTPAGRAGRLCMAAVWPPLAQRGSWYGVGVPQPPVPDGWRHRELGAAIGLPTMPGAAAGDTHARARQDLVRVPSQTMVVGSTSPPESLEALPASAPESNAETPRRHRAVEDHEDDCGHCWRRASCGCARTASRRKSWRAQSHCPASRSLGQRPRPMGGGRRGSCSDGFRAMGPGRGRATGRPKGIGVMGHPSGTGTWWFSQCRRSS